MEPLYILSAVFNPRRFRSRIRLYQHFDAWVKACGVTLLTVEVAFGGRPYDVTEAGNPHHLQLRTRDELWHKERALNLGLQRLCQVAPKWEYVAWMDADIKLVRDDWAHETVHLLQHYAVVQMFGEAANLNPEHHQLWLSRSIMRNYEDHGAIDWYDHPGLTFRDRNRGMYCNPRAGHPGLAWAFRRRELEAVGGWLDVCINGSGDLHMAGCFTGQANLALPENLHPNYRNAILRYGERCEKHIQGNASFMPGLCHHFWHGKSQERGYENRGALLVKHQFDPIEDLSVGPDGLYRWSGTKRAFQHATRKSLRARNEDSIDI